MRARERGSQLSVVCVLACVREREREGDTVTQPRLVCKHMRIIIVSVTRLCSPLGLELMVKLRILLTLFTFILKAKARDYGKGRNVSDAAYGVRPITMHCRVGRCLQNWLRTMSAVKHCDGR